MGAERRHCEYKQLFAYITSLGSQLQSNCRMIAPKTGSSLHRAQLNTLSLFLMQNVKKVQKEC